MSKEHRLIPIEDTYGRVSLSALTLPPFIKGKIGVNLEKTEKLMNIGGILQVKAVNAEKKENTTPQIVGYDSNGNVYGGTGKSKEDATQKKKSNILYETKSYRDKGRTWRSIQVEVSKDQISEDLASKALLQSPEAWGKVINEKIRDSVKNEGRSFSLELGRDIRSYFFDFANTFSAANIVTANMQGEYFIGTSISALMLAAAGFRIRQDVQNPGYRADIFESIHPVRAFWATYRANTAYRNLIEAIPQDS
ncbi:MAG: hypothetical protein KBC00_02495 [Candidatus Levybacteria bacterium]|nr:hypothetical protein [Candidatus Levybacteria bacterium]MBP9814999.1 hypothetical protein [Candidatus Levybacteria bacterium]